MFQKQTASIMVTSGLFFFSKLNGKGHHISLYYSSSFINISYSICFSRLMELNAAIDYGRVQVVKVLPDVYQKAIERGMCPLVILCLHVNRIDCKVYYCLLIRKGTSDSLCSTYFCHLLITDHDLT